MTSSLSNLVTNLSEEIHRIKCKYRHDNKKFEASGMKYKYCNCFLEYMIFTDDLIEYKCKIYQRKFHEKLKEQFFNTYKCSNHNNMFIVTKRCLSL